jgi:hypothetical protein
MRYTAEDAMHGARAYAAAIAASLRLFSPHLRFFIDAAAITPC